MKIINEQYKDRCLYSNFKTTFLYNEITEIKYEKDGSFTIKIKSAHPFFSFQYLKKIC